MGYTIKSVDGFYLVESDTDKTNRLVIDGRGDNTFIGVEFKNSADDYIYGNKELEKVIESGTYNMMLEKLETSVLFKTDDLHDALIELSKMMRSEKVNG